MGMHLLNTRDASDTLTATEWYAARAAWEAENPDAGRPRCGTIDHRTGLVEDYKVL